MPVADALARVLRDAEPLPAEMVPLGEAQGRVLAVDVAAKRTQPPADVSAMDGYAVRASEVAKVPATLKLIGEVAAGHPFEGRVGPGEAARIFTGGVLPAGADTVVIQENTERSNNTLLVKEMADKGKNVRLRGLDFSEGDVLLHKGRRLTDRDLMLAAAMNHPALPVHRMPKIAVLGTGDELVPPGAMPGPGEIVYSNGFALMAMVQREGGTAVDLGIVPDSVDATAAAVRRVRALSADILVTTGGVSVGDYDLVQESLKAEGLALSFWKVALRPGRPVMHGRLGGMHVLGLPGNPVSSYVCALLFLSPLIRRLTGRIDVTPEPETALLGCDLPANDERSDYLRASLTAGPDGVPIATPLPVQDSSMMQSLAQAGCLVIRDPHAQPLKAGSRCPILKLGF